MSDNDLMPRWVFFSLVLFGLAELIAIAKWIGG